VGEIWGAQDEGYKFPSQALRGDCGVGLRVQGVRHGVCGFQAVWGQRGLDFVVGAKKHLRRVQVKSTSSPGFGRYNVGAQHFHGRGAHAYTREEIDFVVAYIVPRNIWYVVPIKALLKKKHMQLYPDGSRWGGKYEKYCEAWHLLA